MTWTETRLEGFIQTVQSEMCVELGGDYFFKNFGDER